MVFHDNNWRMALLLYLAVRVARVSRGSYNSDSLSING